MVDFHQLFSQSWAQRAVILPKPLSLNRAVDKFGDTIYFMLSEHRDEAVATAFFNQTIDANGLPNKVVMDKSVANYAGLENINMLLMCWQD